MVLLARDLVLLERWGITVGINRQRKLLSPSVWEAKKGDRKGLRAVNPSEGHTSVIAFLPTGFHV